jgi:ArsR family transcriptional regulator
MKLDFFPQMFAALADPTRLRIVGLLTRGEVCVCDIYESLKIPQSKASRHLAYLRKAGIVATDKRGLWVYYRLADGDTATRPVLEQLQAALGASETVKRDLARLERKRCCVVPSRPVDADTRD